MRRVLITGGAGFIGSELARALLGRSDLLVALDSLSRGTWANLPASDTIVCVQGDVRDGALIRSLLDLHQVDTVFHLAAMHYIPECEAHPEEAHDVNVNGTRAVLDASRESTVRRLLFASTGAVYAPSENPCDEDTTPLSASDVYGRTKLEAEAAVRQFAHETGVATTILRLFNAIGRRETNPHLLPHIFGSLRHGDSIALGNTTSRRDYLDTRDMAQCLTLLAARGEGIEIVNVGSGSAHSAEEIVATLSGILGRPITILRDPTRLRPVDRPVLVANLARLRQTVEWSPRFSISDTLADLLRAYDVHARPRGGASSGGHGTPPPPPQPTS